MRQIVDTITAHVTPEQMIVAGGAGALAQLATIYDATLGSVITMPFVVLTNALALNWLTGGVRAMVRRDFNSLTFLKAPFRWASYIIAAVLIVQGGMLFAGVTGGMDPSAGIVTALYTLGFIKEGESVISNLGASETVRQAWDQLAGKFGKRGSDAAE
jgi:small basic protein